VGYGRLVKSVPTNNNCAACAAGKYSAVVADAVCIDVPYVPVVVEVDNNDKLPGGTVAIITVGVILTFAVIAAAAFFHFSAGAAGSSGAAAAKHNVELVATSEA